MSKKNLTSGGEIKTPKTLKTPSINGDDLVKGSIPDFQFSSNPPPKPKSDKK